MRRRPFECLVGAPPVRERGRVANKPARADVNRRRHSHAGGRAARAITPLNIPWPDRSQPSILRSVNPRTDTSRLAELAVLALGLVVLASCSSDQAAGPVLAASGKLQILGAKVADNPFNALSNIVTFMTTAADSAR